MRKAKYVHIIWHPDLKFIPNLIKMFNEETNYFKPEEHVFVTPHERVFDNVSNNYEIYLEGNEKENLINRFGDYGEWIFVHAINCSRKDLIRTKSKFAKKVIWRTWGHDIRPYDFSQFNLINYLVYHAYKHKVRQFKAIGVANDVDAVNVNSAFGDVPTWIVSYSYRPELDKLYNVKKIEKAENDPVRILIGHSRSKLDKHIDAMQDLIRFKDDNIIICLILSYGGPIEYGEEVKRYALETFPNKVEVIDSFMTREEYYRYLSTIDIALFPQHHSTALGNLQWLLKLGVPVFVKKDSQFAESFRRQNCSFNTVEDIVTMSVEELKTCRNSAELTEKFGQAGTVEETCELWLDLLNKLS